MLVFGTGVCAINYRMCCRLIVGGLLLVGLLAACRRQGAGQGNTIRPSDTPTPISTPLPAVPTAIPVGTEGNPVQIVFRPVGSPLAARNITARLETVILEEAGLAVEVTLVERYAEALAALCDSGGGQVSVAWLDGPTYTAASAQNCGTPALQVERGRGSNASAGSAAQIIAKRRMGFNTVSQLNADDFCRLGFGDFFSWFAPSLVLTVNGVDPLRDLGSVTDYEDFPTLITAVADGDCDAAGVPENAFDEFENDLDDDVRDKIDVLATTVEFPQEAQNDLNIFFVEDMQQVIDLVMLAPPLNGRQRDPEQQQNETQENPSDSVNV
ncbi:MAG TPA: hypothetical protein EYN15_00070 [Chromatiales bacterium]|nr:hypothetical protein [Chromatiales bacterium]